MNALGGMFSSTISVLAPLLPVALAGLATEYAGVLNIALEGLILLGGFTFVLVGSQAGAVAGLAAAMMVAAAASWLSDRFAVKAKADPFVVGLGLNLLAPGLVSLVSQARFGTKGVVPVPQLATSRLFSSLGRLPSEGFPAFMAALAGHRQSDYLAIFFALLVALVLGTTPFGLRLRATGANPDALRLAGLDPVRTRGRAFALSGLACGVSGAVLAAGIGAWVPNLSAGRGWIALVAIYLGGRRLGGTIVATAVFAMLMAAAGAGQAIPGAQADLLMALPYLLTACVVVIGSWLRKRS
jgi:general nucleoside transport system permease protein